MTTSTKKKPHEQALDAIHARLLSKLSFETDGYDEIKQIFDPRLGDYLRTLEGMNAKDVWSDPSLRELPEFILDFVVERIAQGLKAVIGTRKAGRADVQQVSMQVIKAKATLDRCEIVVRSYQSKINHPDELTPICDVKKLRES